MNSTPAICPLHRDKTVAVQIGEVAEDASCRLRRALRLLHRHGCEGSTARGGMGRARLPALQVFPLPNDPPDLGLKGTKAFWAFETSKRDDPFDEGGFDLSHADKFKLSLRGGACQLKRHPILGVASDLARQDFDLSFKFRA
jgi:hypothetical protein